MSDVTASQGAPAASGPTPFTFKKDNGSLFVLYLKTMFLSVVTLGIYIFWARVAITKFIYSHTSFGGRPFDYHATGKEMFIGFLKGLGIVAGIALVYFVLGLIIPRIAVSILFFLAITLFGIPFVLLGKWRFTLSRSSWCSVRFANDGDYTSLRVIWIKGFLLTIVTLGFYSFVLQNQLQKYYTDKSRFGTLPFFYDGENKEFFWLNLKGALLSIVTIGIYSSWYFAALNRYIMSRTSLKGRRFNSTMTGGGFFIVSLTNILIVVFTLGFGFPIAVNRMYGYFFDNLTLDVQGDDLATAAGTMDTGASALASGIEEAANVVDAISGII